MATRAEVYYGKSNIHAQRLGVEETKILPRDTETSIVGVKR